MYEHVLDAMRQRLEHLERVNCWWRWVGVTAIAILGLAVLLGATQRKDGEVASELRAKQFTLIGEDDTTQATLRVHPGFGAILNFYANHEGKPASVSLYAGGPVTEGFQLGPALHIADPMGELSLSSGSIEIRDPTDEWNKATLSAQNLLISKGGDMVNLDPSRIDIGLNLRSAGGSLTLSARDGAALRLDDKEGRIRAALGVTQLQNPRTGTVEKRSPSSLVPCQLCFYRLTGYYSV